MPDKRVTALAAVAGVVSGLAATSYYWLFRRPIPVKNGTVRIRGLNGPVEIVRDRWCIPHIYAGSLEDLMFAQGYTHAWERLWQMDFNRRLVAGRLAEILGEVAIPLDRWMRTLSMWRIAEKQAQLLDGEARLVAEAFAAGVSTRIAEGRLPVEFTLLRYQPEPWTPADQVAWAKMMAWTLSVNWETELLRERRSTIRPRASRRTRNPYFEECRGGPGPVDYSCIGEEACSEQPQASIHRPGCGERPGEQQLGPGAGLYGHRHAYPANDMHLSLTTPAIWYVNHLVGAGFNVVGVSLPGAPGVIVGHNEQVAWGFTNGFPDVQDLYIEQVRRGEDGRAVPVPGYVAPGRGDPRADRRQRWRPGH
jgi:penicillin amidase